MLIYLVRIVRSIALNKSVNMEPVVGFHSTYSEYLKRCVIAVQCRCVPVASDSSVSSLVCGGKESVSASGERQPLGVEGLRIQDIVIDCQVGVHIIHSDSLIDLCNVDY